MMERGKDGGGMRWLLRRWAILVAAAVLLAVGAYFLPPVHARLAWRLANLQTQVFYWLHPPDQINFKVEMESQPVGVVIRATSTAVATAAITVTPMIGAMGGGTATTEPSQAAVANTPAPSPTAPPTNTPIPLPPKVALSGIRYEWQTFNNCGPTNLAMALSYWGWQGDQRTTKAALRANNDDANVMPEEMAAYAESTGLVKAALRYGGDLALLKRLVAAGFPVLLEIGDQPGKDWWLGHYLLVSGYDEAYQTLITQDSLVMQNLPMPYQEIQAHWWRDFDYVYMVLYPPKREGEVMALLGPDADAAENHRRALQKALDEAGSLSGRDLFFADFNQGDNLLALGDTQGAVKAYDAAFSVYQDIAEKERPWRVMWYRVGPYQANYQAGNYGAVIGLANGVLGNLSKRGLEESHYWRGMAYEAIGDQKKALEDYQIAVMLRPGYGEAAAGVKRLGG